MRRPPRWLRLAGSIVGFALLLAVLIIVVPPYRSLAKTGGRDSIATLDDVVAVQRDSLGVVTIQAGAGRRDAARATGYVHAQERFFQMDLLRRIGAGELSELFGPVALNADRRYRLHQLRAVARRSLERLPLDQRNLIEDYTVGVNAGLNRLAEVPFEYLLLRTKPRPWAAEDSLLVIAAMAFDLQATDGGADRARGTIREVFTPEVARFLLTQADAFAAPLDGSTVALPAVPPAATRRSATPPAAQSRSGATSRPAPGADEEAARLFATYLPAGDTDPDTTKGSNVFAIAGRRANGVTGILANDVHLGLGMPNIWFRLQLRYSIREDRKQYRIVTGVSLPGTPAIVLGSNGDVAWGLTNSYIDTSDVVIVETDPADANRYRTPEGWKEFRTETETLKVRGAPDETVTITRTIWGPVIARDADNRPLALRWAMHEPDAYDFTFMGLENVASVRGALAFAKSAGMPQHNFMCADRDGDIAWTIAGRIPRRIGTDGLAPASWADGSVRWDGWVSTSHHPEVVNPADGILWSANARMVGGDALALLGDGEYDVGSRAVQIRSRLEAKPELTAADAFEIQLDDRALFLERWQKLLLATLSSDAISAQPARGDLKTLAESWGGRAAPESAGYRLVREFRRHVRARMSAVLLAPCLARDPSFKPGRLLLEEPFYVLASQQPEGWLEGGKAGWTQLLLAAVDETITQAGGAEKLARHTWGKFNRLAMRHPLSSGIPGGSWLLDLAGDPMAGDSHVVCAQTPTQGPAERMVVMPGREEESIFHMPGGQSGNPLSSHYSDSHDAWLKREPTPFLPGRAKSHLVLHPPLP